MSREFFFNIALKSLEWENKFFELFCCCFLSLDYIFSCAAFLYLSCISIGLFPSYRCKYGFVGCWNKGCYCFLQILDRRYEYNVICWSLFTLCSEILFRRWKAKEGKCLSVLMRERRRNEIRSGELGEAEGEHSTMLTGQQRGKVDARGGNTSRHRGTMNRRVSRIR